MYIITEKGIEEEEGKLCAKEKNETKTEKNGNRSTQTIIFRKYEVYKRNKIYEKVEMFVVTHILCRYQHTHTHHAYIYIRYTIIIKLFYFQCFNSKRLVWKKNKNKK